MSDPRVALEAIGQLPDIEIDIADAALQLARVDAPTSDMTAARAHLTELARAGAALALEVPVEAVAAQARALAGLLVGRYGYQGDSATYDDPANANLIRVIERRRGLPVALGILWMHTARAAGWDCQGIDFPGHFLMGLRLGGGLMPVDAFAGGTAMEARDLRALLKRSEGPAAELRPGVLRPMSTRDVLLRLQNNIRQRRLAGGDQVGALACVEDMLRIAPDTAPLWRDAALLNQRLDRVAAALRCFGRFVELVPQGDAADRARAAIDELRSRLN